MIVMAIQLRIFVLSLVSGWIYGAIFSFIDLFFYKKRIFYCILNIIFHCLYHIGIFYLLYGLNGGVLRFYYVIVFLIGLGAYYRWYYPLIIPIYIQCIHYVKLPIKRIILVFSQFISIINMLLKSDKRKLGMHNDTSNKKKGC